MSAAADRMRQGRTLLEACCPGCGLWLYSDGGTLAWLNDEDSEAPQTLDLTHWRHGEDGVAWRVENEHRWLAWPVLDCQRQPTHYLVVRSAAVAYDDESLHAAAAPALDTIALALSRESQLLGEIESMARELAVRYEELNLVYHTDDEVRFLDEGQRALRSLVDNCNDYLSVDMSVFLMPDQGVCISRNRPNSPIDGESVIDSLRENVLALLEPEGKTVVFNEPGKTSATPLKIAAKAILSPVTDGHGQVTGALAILRRCGAADFVNSDRNLLVVMAGKASKIIQSSYDSLTGLMRQEGFERGLEAALAHARRRDLRNTLLHINIDQMHLINDTMGYQVGDKVLRAVANALRESLRESDQIARLGGDDFGVLLHNCPMKRGEQVADKLCKTIASLGVEAAGQVIDVSACIGVAALDEESDDIISAQAGAEIACAVAKERGPNRWHIYHRDDAALIERQQQMEWVGRIKEAISHDRLTLYSQRIVPLKEGVKGHHFEVLVRMLGEDGKIQPPAMFLPVAERYQMMPALDRWVVGNTLECLSAHTAQLIEQDIVCTINLSGQSLVDEDFAGFIARRLESNGLPGSLICFEITETAAIANLDDAQRFIHEVKGLGCQFALDDFGAGLSSFAYLRTLPVDYLKLDGSFVKPIAEDKTAAAMLAAMNQIGQIVGLRTVAEFVECDAIVQCLRSMGVDYAQGYGIGKPRPIAEELATLERVRTVA